jgi:hypothetical protein
MNVLKRFVLPLIVALAVVLVLTGCTSAPGSEAGAAKPVAAAPPSPATSLAEAVHADAEAIASDLASVPLEVGLSSNPYDYVPHSPAFKRLVARGAPAVDAIADEIQSSKDNGLKEYLLAIAASEILREPAKDKTWVTGKDWATGYLATHK